MMFSQSKLFNLFRCYPTQKLYLSVCHCYFKGKENREANFMRKLLKVKSSKKHYYQEDRSTKSVSSVINDPSSQRRTPMRVSVLNKLFMTNITDILAAGSTSTDIIGRGMEVTNVSVNRDYQLIKVYWTAKSPEDEIWLENNLSKISLSLRHELSQLHLIGSIPRIQFILDKRLSQLATLDSLIIECDKGSDDEIDPAFDYSDDIIPVMTNNVYGLQYDLIVSKLTRSLNKAKASHRKAEIQLVDSSTDCESASMISKYSQKEAIRKFLLQKKLREEKYKKNKFNNLDTYRNEVHSDLLFDEENDVDRQL